MRIHGSLYQEATPDLLALIQQPRRGHDGPQGVNPGQARKLALQEMGRALGVEFKSVTHALRALLASAGAAGGDPVPRVLDQVNQALEKAGAALKEAGLSDEQVAATLKDVREKLGASLAGSAEETAVQGLVYARKDKANLDIVTQEGDEVRIRFRSREGFIATASGAASDQPRNVYAFASGRVEISVNGELSAEELEAIGELVADVEALAQDFFAGDIQKAFEAAASLGFDGEQIASIALKLSTHQLYRGALPSALSAPRQENTTPKVEQAPVPTPAPTSGPAPLASTAPVDAQAPADAAPATDEVSETSAPVDPFATDPETLPAEVSSPIVAFLQQVMSLFGEPLQAGRFEFSMQWSLKLVIDAIAAHDPEPTPSSGTELLGDTLNAVAASEHVAEPVPEHS